MAVPKKRTTRSAQGQRRSHDALTPISLTTCGNCGKLMKPHNACPSCGSYRGRNVVKI